MRKLGFDKCVNDEYDFVKKLIVAVCVADMMAAEVKEEVVKFKQEIAQILDAKDIPTPPTSQDYQKIQNAC